MMTRSIAIESDLCGAVLMKVTEATSSDLGTIQLSIMSETVSLSASELSELLQAIDMLKNPGNRNLIFNTKVPVIRKGNEK